MQSDVLNDQQALSNESDCSPPSLPTTLIYSGLKLVRSSTMSSEAFTARLVASLSAPETIGTDHLNA